MISRLFNWLQKSPPVPTFVPCPHCGADIRDDASFCRHCGSSDADGWSDPYQADEFGDEDDFDYESYVAEHHSDSLTNTNLAPVWRAVIVILVIAFAASLLIPRL